MVLMIGIIVKVSDRVNNGKWRNYIRVFEVIEFEGFKNLEMSGIEL